MMTREEYTILLQRVEGMFQSITVLVGIYFNSEKQNTPKVYELKQERVY